MSACEAHFGFDPDSYGFIGGTILRMTGLAPPKQVFTVHHLPTKIVEVGEESYFMIQYERPVRATAVSLELKGSKNIELIDQRFVLNERSGNIQARFKLTGSGHNVVDITIRGEYKEETIAQHSKIFIGSKPSLADKR